jgi:hypothetical protein
MKTTIETTKGTVTYTKTGLIFRARDVDPDAVVEVKPEFDLSAYLKPVVLPEYNGPRRVIKFA